MILFEWILVLLFAAVVLTAAAERLRVPYPSLLAIAGACIAFLPFAPDIRIEPDLALALFVAPALLDAAFDTSPRELRRNVIPVVSRALFAVLLTTASVAFLGWRFAGLPIAAAITLGAIVAPPDAAAAVGTLLRIRSLADYTINTLGSSFRKRQVALWISSATFAAIRDARGGSVLSGCSRRRVVMCCPSIAVWRQ
jgi:CPA1 family monovalent cation:H+ antiporter